MNKKPNAAVMKKILLIEDNKDIRNTLKEVLSLSGYEIIVAEDGLIGVEKAFSETPDLILCDVRMPRLDGFGTLRILNQKPETSSIPFIFLTANGESCDFRKGMSLGADDYIVKPFDLQDLLNSVETRLKKRSNVGNTFKGAGNIISEQKGQKELEQLLKEKKNKSYQKKKIMFQEGELPQQIFYLVKGKVKVSQISDSGKEFITNIYKEGEFIGACALLKKEAYQKSAIAIEDSEIISISSNRFIELLNNSPHFSAYFIKILVDELFEKESQLVYLAYSSIRKRVAKVLLKLHTIYQESEQRNISILREDMANMVGTTKESISRTLSELKSENLINITPNGLIAILNEDRLKMLIEWEYPIKCVNTFKIGGHGPLF